MIVVPNRRLITRQMPHCRRQSTFELVIIIGIEKIVLAVILIVDDSLHRAQATFEQTVLSFTFRTIAIGIAAPGNIGAGEVGVGVPTALIDQGLQPRPVGAGFRAEHAVASAAARLR